MIRVSRFRTPSAAVFAARLRQELGWGSLSRQAIYDWEAGRSRVPAVAILAAARVINVSVGELSAIADRFRCPRTEARLEQRPDGEQPRLLDGANVGRR